jgi:hypothetical protein
LDVFFPSSYGPKLFNLPPRRLDIPVSVQTDPSVGALPFQPSAWNDADAAGWFDQTLDLNAHHKKTQINKLINKLIHKLIN